MKKKKKEKKKQEKKKKRKKNGNNVQSEGRERFKHHYRGVHLSA